MRASLVISAVLIAFLSASSSAAPDKVVCYFCSWGVCGSGNGEFDIESIDARLCTHVVYSFVGIKKDGSIQVDAYNDLEGNGGRGGFKRFVNLKNKAPGLKVLVAIGGGNERGTTFSEVVGSTSLRSKFVQNVVNFVLKYKFDGFDLDWEYPADPERGGRREDVKNFSKLIRELRAAFDPRGLILSAAVVAIESTFVNFYEVAELSRYLHFINVMSYDLHGYWEPVTGINAPLYARTGDTNPQLNVKACIEAWIHHGADPNKLILGMGTYGYSFTLANPSNHGVGAPRTGKGKPGKYSKEAGTLGYDEIVEMLRDGELIEAWEDQQKVPYAYKGDQWVGYDNERSIRLKCEYAKQMGLGGGMIWKIDTDDFRGVSGTKFALLKTINKVFGRSV